MTGLPGEPEKLSFTVGDELKLADLLPQADAGPVLDALVAAGVPVVQVTDAEGRHILQRGDAGKSFSANVFEKRVLRHEGESCAWIEAAAGNLPAAVRAVLLDIAQAALQTMMRSAARRLLTAEAHTTVVNLSYEELLAVNEDLRRSEARYRSLADSLEHQVVERTAALEQAHLQMLRQDKQAAIGQLAAGMAHEVNNPVGFMLSNLRSLSRYMSTITAVLNDYRNESPAHARKFRESKLDFMIEDIPLLLAQSIDGGERIHAIVAALKNFSHIDEVAVRDVGLKSEITTVVTVLQHEIAARSATIRMDDVADVTVPGNGAHIAQALLAVILNALQARPSGVTVSISVRQSGRLAEIAIRDNGEGMSPETLQRAFEPFFTTREVGAGTGLGLTLAHDVITAHGGTIELTSSPGEGTIVHIQLPAGGGA